MINSIIVAALTDDKYEQIEFLLEDSFRISSNLSSQELVLDAIPKMKPSYLIVREDLPGSRSFSEFASVIRSNYPDLKIIVPGDDLDQIKLYLTGELPVPEYVPPEQEEVSDANNAEDDKDPEEDITSLKFKRIPVYKNRNHEKASLDWFMNEDLGPTQKDWERATESTVDLLNLLQKVIVVTGPSGGIGKTQMAINLACHFNRNGFKTALLGFNLQNDDIASRLGLDYKRGKKLLTAFELYLEKKLYLESLLDVMQDYKGMQVLVGIEKPIEREEMGEDFFTHIIKVLKPHFDFVVVDTENNSYSPSYLPVIEIADNVLVPCTTDPTVLGQLVDELHDWKDEFDIPLSKVDIILNKAGEGGFVTKDVIEKNTMREVIAEIPYSKDILKSSEREIPAVYYPSFGAVRIRREFDKLVYRYAGERTRLMNTVKPTYLHYKKKVKRLVTFQSK